MVVTVIIPLFACPVALVARDTFHVNMGAVMVPVPVSMPMPVPVPVPVSVAVAMAMVTMVMVNHRLQFMATPITAPTNHLWENKFGMITQNL